METMQLHGIHHITAVTADAPRNLHFYTKVLGLRLVKKTVNQDDTSAYHLFYADKLGSPGTDMTFFDWPQAAKNTPGTDAIVRTLFRVDGERALQYWRERLEKNKVSHSGIVKIGTQNALLFADPEGQLLGLVDDGGVAFDGEVWDGAGVPAEHALRGFYAAQLAIPQLVLVDGILTHVLNWEKMGTYENPEQSSEKITIYAMDGGGPGKEVHIIERRGKLGQLGVGGVHHMAFRLKDNAEQNDWLTRLAIVQLPNSGVVDRFYFKSLYFRISEGILFELATDGPGFSADESAEHLGEKLALPPFLEEHRAEIEADLKPLEDR